MYFILLGKRLLHISILQYRAHVQLNFVSVLAPSG